MNTVKRLAPIFLMLILMSVSVYADDFKDGENAYERGNYTVAFEKFELLAEQGNPQAQWLLAGMYARGLGVATNYVQALKWSAIAGANGVEIANLGGDLLRKQMTPHQINKAYRQAREWIKAHN